MLDQPWNKPVLCADDYGMSDGVSEGISDLAHEHRLSATSALVTGSLWKTHGQNVAQLRKHIAVGLHVSLTWGGPLGSMPTLAPGGNFPAIGELVRAALLRKIDEREVAQQVERQVREFSAVAGCLPDFVDGHEHAHALPSIRRGFVEGLARAAPNRKWVVRDPSDTALAILERGVSVVKALGIKTLATGFRSLCRQSGFANNGSFAGYSSFGATPGFDIELQRFFLRPTANHLIMCHPGRAERGAASDDVIAVRRTQEFSALLKAEDLPDRIWRGLHANAPLLEGR